MYVCMCVCVCVCVCVCFATNKARPLLGRCKILLFQNLVTLNIKRWRVGANCFNNVLSL